MVHSRGGSYREEIFKRLEFEGITTDSSIADWLTNNGKRTYTAGMRNLHDELLLPFEVDHAIDNANNFSKLNQAEAEIDNVTISDVIPELRYAIETRRNELSQFLRLGREESRAIGSAERRSQFFGEYPEENLNVDRSDILESEGDNVKWFARVYDVTQEEATQRITNLGFNVDEAGNIIS